MPAMTPSTTSRARTSRWASRATIAGSSQRCPSRSPGRAPPGPRAAPVAVPRVPGARSLMGSLVPCGPGDVVALAERALARERRGIRVAREGGASLPASKARDAEQQLHLGFGDVTQAEAHARVPHHRARGIQELDPAAHAANLLHAVVVRTVVHPHAAALVRQLPQELP